MGISREGMKAYMKFWEVQKDNKKLTDKGLKTYYEFWEIEETERRKKEGGKNNE